MAAPIRLGVIGLSTSGGWASTLLLPVLNKDFPVSAKYKIAALCTSNEKSAAASASTYGEKLGYKIKAYHGSDGYKQIAQDSEVDVVMSVVHVTHHKETILPALQAGKNVFVEWPLGSNLAEAQELNEVAKSNGVKITAIGAQGTQSPIAKKVAEAIKAGKIGRVISTSIILNCTAELGFWGPLITKKAQSLVEADNSATLIDIHGGHFFATFITALGEDFASLSAVRATRFPDYQLIEDSGLEPTSSETFKRTSEDNVAISGVLRSGAVASLHFRSGLAQAKPGRSPFLWLIDGTEGTIKMEDDGTVRTASFIHLRHPALYINGEKVTFDPPPADYIHNINAFWEEFAKGSEGQFPSFETAVQVHKITDAIARSAKEGKRIDID